ncbi:DegT/DnrJ/EryC1/StrS family aminotransferase [Brevibacillus sp. SYSU BS000544]|uniref:DegT/DnrJ/EryC1/StrS family aminotransferase n=1 Tax=Brevibacillus sp. SYSU BS000544 TaxID=3416443 RepID=UPI003CE4AB3E
MNIPILDLSPEIDSLWDELMPAIQNVLRSGQFIMGPNVKTFEKEVANYLGVKHAIGLNSGTDALFIGLKAVGVEPGDEVITTPFTFFATAEAISHLGATPVFVDVNEKTYNLDVEQVEKAITSRTKAIIPVHLFGQSVDMDELLAVANRHNIKIVEDVAQGFGGDYKGKKLGTLGDVGCFSFFPSKNLGAYGDGGLLVTNDDHIAQVSSMLRSHGSKKKYYNELVGYNSRLDEIQGAILRVKLPHIDQWNDGRRKVAQVYRELLSNIPGIVLPYETDDRKHVYHQYTIRVLGGKRDEVQQKLAEMGINTMIYYPVPVHRLPVYESQQVSMPISEKLASEVLSLPIWPTMEREKQESVADCLKATLL